MTRKIGIIGIPLGYGAGQTGSELGVNAMRLTRFRGQNLAEHIRNGYEVIDHGDVAVVQPAPGSNGSNPKHLAEMLASSENIIPALPSLLNNDELPIILAGYLE